jgi:hypothetical protein
MPTTPTSIIADPFDQQLQYVASVLVRDLSGTGDAYGKNSPTFSTIATGVKCAVIFQSVPADREFLAKSKEGIAFRKVLLRPWYVDASPDGSWVPQHVYNGTTYNTKPLSHAHWLLINSENYDIYEVRNPGWQNHHFEALCRLIEV